MWEERKRLTDLVVTRQMLDAGGKVVEAWDCDYPENTAATPREVAQRAFEEMWKARRKNAQLQELR
jgi:hypothetical protein